MWNFEEYNFSLKLNKNLISMCFSSYTQRALCYPDLRNKRRPHIYLFQDFWISLPANSYVNFLLPYAWSRLLNLPLPHQPKFRVLCSIKSSKWKFLLNLHHCWSFTASFKNIENKNHLNSAAWLYNSSKLNLKCASQCWGSNSFTHFQQMSRTLRNLLPSYSLDWLEELVFRYFLPFELNLWMLVYKSLSLTSRLVRDTANLHY